LMEEHFNENYMESDKFPKASFKGKITDLDKVVVTKDGVYNVTVSGDLTMHGVAKKTTAIGNITVKDGKMEANSTFNVTLADYGISIPSVVKDNISKTVEIKVSCRLDNKM